MNPIYEQRRLGLDPKIQLICRQLLVTSFSKGIDARVIQGRRTREEQQALFDKGITKARPGYSWHNFGLAFDIGIFRPDGTYVDNDDTLIIKVVGPLAEKLGFRWGYRWTHPDTPHFQAGDIPDSPTAEWRKKAGF